MDAYPHYEKSYLTEHAHVIMRALWLLGCDICEKLNAKMHGSGGAVSGAQN